MRPLIALSILGSIVTSASAAGTDIHGLVDAQTGPHRHFRAAVNTKPTNEQWHILALQPRRRQLWSLVTGGRHGTNRIRQI